MGEKGEKIIELVYCIKTYIDFLTFNFRHNLVSYVSSTLKSDLKIVKLPEILISTTSIKEYISYTPWVYKCVYYFTSDCYLTFSRIRQQTFCFQVLSNKIIFASYKLFYLNIESVTMTK